MSTPQFDVIVIGGGPSGATAAQELSARGWRVMLLDRQGRTKPCGGAIPPRLIRDYAIPDELLVAKIRTARMVAPSSREVDIHIDNGFVGMVDRDVFDEWLRNRAAQSGAVRERGRFERLEPDPAGGQWVHYERLDGHGGAEPARAHARLVAE